MRIGNAPCSWGIEFADDPRNPSWERVLDECVEAGFEGMDLGPVGFFPEDPALLEDAFAKRRLKLSSGSLIQPFHDPSLADHCRDVVVRTCKSLASQGATQIILMDSIAAERTRTLGRPQEAPKLTMQGWADFVKRIDESARIATQEYGITASIHSHAGGYCDFEEELNHLLDEVDEDFLKICIDTAHMTLAGMDPLKMTSRYASRVAYVHLKDIDPIKKQKVIMEGIDFYTACADDMFCQMGKGEFDFLAFKVLLEDIGFDGWCTVEQDCRPDATISKAEMACANREFLIEVGF